MIRINSLCMPCNVKLNIIEFYLPPSVFVQVNVKVTPLLHSAAFSNSMTSKLA